MYANAQGGMNMGGSFNQGVNHTRQIAKGSQGGGRPITSSSGKLVTKKKVVSAGGAIGPNGQIYNMHSSF
jgi:hypothetical protein